MNRKPKKPWSLAARLTAWYAVWAFGLVLGSTGVLYWALAENLEREDDQILADEIQDVRTLLETRAGDVAALRQAVNLAGTSSRRATVLIRLLDDHGIVLLESPSMSSLPSSEFPTAPPQGAAPANEFTTSAGVAYRLTAVRIELPISPARSFLVQAALDETYEEQLLSEYRRTLWVVLALSLLACTFGGYQVARRGTRPFGAMAATAREIRSSTLHQRLETAGLSAELAEVAATLNGMLDRLQDSFGRLSRFSADLAHELRTPINNLRGEVEVALGKRRSEEEYRDVLASCLEECVRLSQIVESLLFMAQAENPKQEIVCSPVSVARELETVREFYEAPALERGITLSTVASESVVASLDRVLFQRAVSNLVANALVNTPPPGTIELRADERQGRLRVQVADTGSGIAAEHLPYLFDRLYRVDHARSKGTGGLGLGLSIVKTIAELHGGTVAVESTPGRGTTVTLDLPLGPSGDSR